MLFTREELHREHVEADMEEIRKVIGQALDNFQGGTDAKES